jgi:RNA recognition motif-containing protein
MFDRETGRSRGFGFVTFVDPSVCQHLLQLGNTVDKKRTEKRTGRLEMRGKIIEIKSSEPKQLSGNTKRSARLQLGDNITAIGSLLDLHVGRPQQWYNPAWTARGQSYYQQQSSLLPYQYMYQNYPATTANYYSHTGFTGSPIRFLETNAWNRTTQPYEPYYITQPLNSEYDYSVTSAYHSVGYLPEPNNNGMPSTSANTTSQTAANSNDVNKQYSATSPSTSVPDTASMEPSVQLSHINDSVFTGQSN